MKGVNEVFLLGNVGSDPEIRATSGGSRIASVSLATSRYAKQGEEPKTDWHRLKVFGKLVDVVEQYVQKGDRLHVRGRIEYSQTEADGQKRYWTDIIVNDLTLLGTNGGAKSADEPAEPLPF